MVYRKIYIDKIIKYIDTPFVKILTGVRRSGKTTIMKMLLEEILKRGIDSNQILYYNFDSIKYENIKVIDLFNDIKSKISKSEKKYIFLDEIQEIENWEKLVNTLMNDYDVDIYVTGSNSRMLASEISTYLTGRYITFRIFPLSFSEYLDFRKQLNGSDKSNIKNSTCVIDEIIITNVLESTNIDKEFIRKEFLRYLLFGGFPAIHLRNYTEEEAYAIVKDIYNSTIFTDIVRRNSIRKIDQFERVVRYVFDNIGNTFSATTITNFIKSEHRTLDNETVYNYLSKLERAYIIDRCSRYDIKGKEILKTQEKFYVADPALKYSIFGYNINDISSMMKNIVYIELLRRGYTAYVGKFNQYEIDFVGVNRENKIYIQVAKSLKLDATIEREYKNLLEINDNCPKYVLCYDDFAKGNVDGIKTMHIADFLLMDDWE